MFSSPLRLGHLSALFLTKI